MLTLSPANDWLYSADQCQWFCLLSDKVYLSYSIYTVLATNQCCALWQSQGGKRVVSSHSSHLIWWTEIERKSLDNEWSCEVSSNYCVLVLAGLAVMLSVAVAVHVTYAD